MLLPGQNWHPLRHPQPRRHRSSVMPAGPAERKKVVFFFPQTVRFSPKGFTLCSRGCWVQLQGHGHMQRRGDSSATPVPTTGQRCHSVLAQHLQPLMQQSPGLSSWHRATICLHLTCPEDGSPLGTARHPGPGWKPRAGGERCQEDGSRPQRWVTVYVLR